METTVYIVNQRPGKVYTNLDTAKRAMLDYVRSRVGAVPESRQGLVLDWLANPCTPYPTDHAIWRSPSGKAFCLLKRLTLISE